MPVIPALRKKDCNQFQANLRFVVRPVSKNKPYYKATTIKSVVMAEG
jgi:hypothetical protein